jgi:prepilin-type N-terminal cleavage/methylation domain-containing protein
MIAALRTSAGLRKRRDDAGYTLVELLVGMTILSIFLAILGTATFSMFRSVNLTQQSDYATSQLNQAYIRLEREVRFASGISNPGVDNFNQPSVEFADTTSGVQICTQIRLAPGGVLQQRTWTDDGSPPVFSTPTTLAIDVAADTPTAPASADPSVSGPFATLPVSANASNEQLEIAVNVRQASQTTGTNTRVRHLDATFTAANTDATTTSSSVCVAGRSASWPAN